MLADIVYAPTAGQYSLLKVFFVFTSLLYLPYISLLLGSSIISACLNGCCATDLKRSLATNIMHKTLGNAGLGLALGVVPSFSLAVIYTQLAYDSGSAVSSFMVTSTIFTFIGVLFLYRFRQALIIVNNTAVTESNEAYIEGNQKAAHYTGAAGIVAMLIALYFYVASFSLLLVPEWWQTVTNPVSIMFTWDLASRFLAALGGCLGFAASAILAAHSLWGKNEHSDEYNKAMANAAGSVGIPAIVIMAVFTMVNMFVIPNSNIDYCAQIAANLGLVALFVVCHTQYYAMRYQKYTIGGAGFFLFLLTFFFHIMADQALMSNAVADHAHKVVEAHGGDDGHH